MSSLVSTTFPAAGLESARPTSVDTNPAFYSATDTGVVWRSDDFGATWVAWALALPPGTTDGDVPVWDVASGSWVPGGGSGGGGGIVSHASLRRTSGDVPVSSTNYADLGSSPMELVLAASAGDLVQLTIQATVSGSAFCALDFVTVVAGTLTNSVIQGGVPTVGGGGGWERGVTDSNLSGSRHYTVQAGDIDAGSVRFRLRGRGGGSSIVAGTDPDFYMAAINFGS